jgi:hypothetical protein
MIFLIDNSNYASSCLHVVLHVFIFMLSHVDPTLLFQTLSLNQKITNPSFELRLGTCSTKTLIYNHP